MKKSYDEIRQYLKEVKTAVSTGQYRIEHSNRRPDNAILCRDYLLSETGIQKILLSLTEEDFCKTLCNQHKGFEHEQLYVFGKDVTLSRRLDIGDEKIPLYIKINKLDNQFVIIVSFYKQTYPLTYAFPSRAESQSQCPHFCA